MQITVFCTDLEEVLHTFGVVAIAFSADSLHLFDLACFARGLNVFEVNFRILAEVHNGAQEIEQTFKAKKLRISKSSKTKDTLGFVFLHLPH